MEAIPRKSYSQKHTMARTMLLIMPFFVLSMFFAIFIKADATTLQNFWKAPLETLNTLDLWPAFFILVFVFSLLFVIKLEWRFDHDGFHYRFFPFHIKWKHLAWHDIQQLSFMAIKPLRDFGGWGLRFSSKYGRAYTTSGKHVIHIVLNSGKKLNFTAVQDPKLDKWINRA
jgi:hypothetical protein